mgnify:FL=1|tara:strand:- start:273 stop:602 length:330 start_codon:yes stop_codon:yes gene_type:complete
MFKRFLVSCSLFITGCAGYNTSMPPEQGGYFCYTTETIRENGDGLSSENITECSDKPRVEHFVKDTGMAKDCTPYRFQYNTRSTVKHVEAFLCRFPDGSWQAVDGRYAY